MAIEKRNTNRNRNRNENEWYGHFFLSMPSIPFEIYIVSDGWTLVGQTLRHCKLKSAFWEKSFILVSVYMEEKIFIYIDDVDRIIATKIM